MKNYLHFVIFLLGIFGFSHIYSQDFSDSLKLLLKTTEDTNKINILNKLGNYYSERDEKQSNKYSMQAILLSEKLNFQKGKALAYNNIGIVCDIRGDYDSALYFYNSALKIAKTIGIPELNANVNSNIGLVYWNQGEYEKALETYLISLRIFEKINNKKGLSNVLSNIGLIYYDLHNYKEALKYHFQSLKIRENINYLYGIGVSLSNIGLVYMDLDSLPLSIVYFEKAMDYKIKSNDDYGLAIVYNNLATAHMGTDNKEALRYEMLAVNLNKKLNDTYGLITNYNNLANIYRLLGDNKTQFDYLTLSLNLAEELQSKSKLLTIYKLHRMYYYDNRDYKNAYIYYHKYDSIKSLIYSIESTQSMNEMQVKYDTEKKEHQLKLKSVEAKNQKNRNKVQLLLFIGMLSILIFISIMIIYRNRERHKSQLLEEKIKQDKILFKAMIDSESKERKRIASELHDSLGQLLCTAKIIVSSLDDAVAQSDEEDKIAYGSSLELIDEALAEVRNISHNLMPVSLISVGLISALEELIKKINSSDKLKVKFNYPENVKKLDETIEINIYRIIQEVINNAIKHADAKNIIIDFKQTEKNVTIDISDDGKGMDVTKISKSKGIGWNNIYSRVNLLNGKIDINSEIGKGTKLFINLNIIS